MIDWIIENKEWVFSGIGVFVISIVLALMTKKNGKKQIQKGGKNSKNYQSGGDITISKK